MGYESNCSIQSLLQEEKEEDWGQNNKGSRAENIEGYFLLP